MSSPTDTSGTEAATDPFFGFLAGLYAAALVAPPVTVGLVVGVTTDPAVLFFAVLGTVVAVVAGVGWVARRASVAVALGRTRWAWLAPLVGFGWGGALLLWSVGSEAGSSAAAGVSMLGMFAGGFVGLGLAAAAGNRHARAVLDGAEEYARFRARAPERDRRLTVWAAVVLGGAGLVGLGASFLVEDDSLLWLFQLLVPVAAGLAGSSAERTVAVADAGLLVGNPVRKRVLSWDEFESYSLTDDALVVRRAGWSPWGLRDIRRDPADIEDPDAVADALARVLPRRGRN